MRCPWSCRRLASLATVLFAVLADDPELRARLQITFEDETQANASVTRVLELTGGTPLRDAALGFCAAHGLNATRHVGAIETALVQELERMKHAGVVEARDRLHHTNGSRSVTTIVLRPGVSSRRHGRAFGGGTGCRRTTSPCSRRSSRSSRSPRRPVRRRPSRPGDQPRAAAASPPSRVAGALLTPRAVLGRRARRHARRRRRATAERRERGAGGRAPGAGAAQGGRGRARVGGARLVVAMAEQVEASVEDAVQARGPARGLARARRRRRRARDRDAGARPRRSSPSRSSARSASMQPQPSPSMAPSRSSRSSTSARARRSARRSRTSTARRRTGSRTATSTSAGSSPSCTRARPRCSQAPRPARAEGDESARLLEQALALQRSAAKVSRHIQQKDIVRRMRGSSVPAGVLDMAAAAEPAERFEAVEHVERVPVQPRFGARAAPSAHKSASPSLPSRVGDDSSTVSSSACDAADSDEEAHIEDEYREIWRGMGNGAGNGEHDEADFQRWYKQVIGPQLGSR